VFYFSLAIVVIISKNKSDKVLIRVDVTSDGAEGACNDTTWWQKRTDFNWTVCAETDNPKTCGEHCGFGTGRANPLINGM